jgi:hypothetical protein
MPQLLRRLIVASLALVAAACGSTSGGQGGSQNSPPPHDVAIEIPEAAGESLDPGRIVEVVYPGGESRGLRHYLQRWDGEAWVDAYQVFLSDPDQPLDEERVRNAWAEPDVEQPVESIGFQGSDGGQFTVIPPPTDTGTYRLCDEPRVLCSAAFAVAD